MRATRFARFLIIGMLTLFIITPANAKLATLPASGGLDCNGLSKVQKSVKPNGICTDFRLGDERGEDNGVYIGHDEPSIGFYSNTPGSGNNVQWEFTLPTERKLPATQTFENQIAFWFSMALCDPNSFPNGTCIPNSDANNPNTAGSAFLEMQFYPPGMPPFITRVSCDLEHWCASLHINSLEVTSDFQLNPNCTEPTNFGFIQKNGVPTGPAGPANATDATFTPNDQTLLMNQGDHIRITIRDTPAGLLNRIDDLTTHQSGFMVASAANGFQSLNRDTCAPTPFAFHPEFNTAKFGNFVPWAVLQANVNFASEIGHFEPGPNGDGDEDDPPCFPDAIVPGCLNFALGGDIDFDGTSYLRDWPDGSRNNATPVLIGSVLKKSFGPASFVPGKGYVNTYPTMQFETTVSASEAGCQPSGAGCVVPPTGAAFYPFYTQVKQDGDCMFSFGDVIRNRTVNDFGQDAQYGGPNLPWFFGQNSSGELPTPCLQGKHS
jgi:hypothetical protein